MGIKTGLDQKLADGAAKAIAPMSFPKDWPAIEALIGGGIDEGAWLNISNVVLRGRLNRLYFDPIHRLTRAPGERGQGEGFSILTIQCSVLEFLAALRSGWSFKHGHKVQGQDNFYGNSKLLFTSFLLSEEPFASSFTTAERANQFYTDVRCGLVHEGQTKNAWRIWRGQSSDPLIDFVRKAVYRDVMQRQIETYLDRYCTELSQSVPLQQAFVRKFAYLSANNVQPTSASA